MKTILTNEELVKLYHTGNPSALEALYLQNYGLIRSTVGKLCRYKPESFEDEMQEAFFDLVEAVKSFPDDKDVKLATYIVNSIRWRMYRRREAEYKKRPPKIASLDEPLPGFEDSDITLGDTVADPDAEFEEDCIKRVGDQQIQDRLKAVISEIISGLPKRSQEVIRERLKGRSRADIARERKVSVSNVEEAEYRAHREFRKRENREKLAEFLDYYNLGYKNTGFGFWRDTGYSSVEWAIERKLTAESRSQKGVDDR